MNIDELKQLLSQRENCEIEYKSAKGGFPKAFWPTYSSFGNTNGGFVVLGMKEENHVPVIDNLSEGEVEKLKRDYWAIINDGLKVNCILTFEEDVQSYELDGGAWVLAFRIPRAEHYQKPIYLNGNPLQGAYKRRNEGDFHCSEDEVKQMMSDANLQRSTADARILRNFTMEDIDQSSLSMFRKEFKAAKANHAWTDLSDIEFLKRIGGYRVDRVSGEEGFTVAGMLMFGKEESITDGECSPNFYVDYREHMTDIVGERWSDRIYPNGRWNANLYLFFVKQFYQGQQSICRNTCLQRMFVALGIGEKAGSGADTIVKGWTEND